MIYLSRPARHQRLHQHSLPGWFQGGSDSLLPRIRLICHRYHLYLSLYRRLTDSARVAHTSRAAPTCRVLRICLILVLTFLPAIAHLHILIQPCLRMNQCSSGRIQTQPLAQAFRLLCRICIIMNRTSEGPGQTKASTLTTTGDFLACSSDRSRLILVKESLDLRESIPLAGLH